METRGKRQREKREEKTQGEEIAQGYKAGEGPMEGIEELAWGAGGWVDVWLERNVQERVIQG